MDLTTMFYAGRGPGGRSKRWIWIGLCALVSSFATVGISPATASATGEVPGAPTIGTATAGAGSASVAFTAPSSAGSSPITSYTVTAADQTTSGNGGQTASGSASPITIAGLTIGDTYTFTVTATNTAGTGDPSDPSNPVVPYAGSETFTTAGCNTWSVPSGDTWVGVDAVGAAGSGGEMEGPSRPGGAGGVGDEVTGTLTGLTSDEALDVCVDSGGGTGRFGTYNGGGGASGVSLGATFATPVVVAAGGGGGGSGDNSGDGPGGAGGNAGSPSGATGGTEGGTGGGGGSQSTAGGTGTGSSSSGPGTGGNGIGGPGSGCGQAFSGAGGGGYYGGGAGGCSSGGSGGGGGGSDYCDASVTNCNVNSGVGTGTGAGDASGDAQVTLTFYPVVPNAPVVGTATGRGPGTASVTFSPPGFDGGSPVTGYTVTATDETTSANGGQTATGTTSPITVDGLVNGDTYIFTVTATNAIGTGDASDPSNSVQPPEGTANFTTEGCTQWTVPSGVSSVGVDAVGAAGGGGGSSGGTGDEVSGTLTGLTPDQTLDICVDSGGGSGASGGGAAGPGGNGGGASGVGLGVDFSDPVVVAGGGGGSGGRDACGGDCGTSGGGDAGFPAGVSATSFSCYYGGGDVDGGTGGGTQSTYGTGGTGSCSSGGSGNNGTATTGSGPGTGGSGGSAGNGDSGGGGGGGAGYYGGGGGAGGGNEYGGAGGGGGSDYCDTTSVTSCTVSSGTGTQTVAGGASGDAQVTLTYLPVVPPGAPTIGTATGGDAQASVAFTAPTYTGGATITGYTVTATDTTTPANGNEIGDGATSPITVSGLTNGDTYSFTVTATNAVGTSLVSSASNTVVPAGIPKVSQVTPNNGPDSGGTSITINGSGFVNGARVEIGQGHGPGPTAIPAGNVKVVSYTQITATTGANAKAGNFNLFVITAAGTSRSNKTDRFQYQRTPALGASGPNNATAGRAISASSIKAVLSGGVTPTGSVTFTVFGPQANAPTTCSTGGTPVGTATVSGNHTYHPGSSFTLSNTGDYWWYASYSGDTNNTTTTSACGSGMSETVAS